jgi:AcrR family transcriptional regulator
MEKKTKTEKKLNTTRRTTFNSRQAKRTLMVEKKQEQIVKGACELFFEKGYHPTTVRDIAKACNISMGQLYYYIKSKDDVLYLLHKFMQKAWYEHLEKTNTDDINDPLDRFTQSLRTTLEYLNNSSKTFQFIYTESKHLNKKRLREVLRMDYKNTIGFWHQNLIELSKHIPIRSDLDFAASLIAYLTVFMPLRGWSLTKKPPEENINLLIDFILRGIGVIS